MPSVKVDGVRLHFRERGTGRPLLLVHGFPLDHSMWQGQIDALSGSCRVLAPDLRGFGRSEATTGTVTMAQFADDLAELLEALSISEPVVYCGLSMGGYIGWQFWQRHAAMLAGLILCDTRAEADTVQAAQGRRATADQVLSDGPQQLVDNMFPRLFAADTIRNQPELVAHTRDVMLGTSRDGIAAALRGMAERADCSPHLSRIAHPTLVICGEHDVISPPQEMRGIAAAIPSSQFVLIPDAGHMAPLEQPSAVNQAVTRFLADLVV